MLYQITEIEFNIDTEDELSMFNQGITVDETIGQIWEANDEDDLIDEITCATGYDIKFIDYRHILS